MSRIIISITRVALIILWLTGSLINAQNLIESRQTSYLTYIYKLTNDEARKIYSKDIWEVDPSYFHTLVDSFPTDSEYKGTLPPGHYLKTYSYKSRQKIFILSVPEFDVKILNNNTDLCIQVYDLKGKLIPDADVQVRLKNIRFDHGTQSYIDKKSNQKGLLKVSHGGYTAFYKLSRSYNNSSLKRGTKKIAYGTPLIYVWVPVNYVINIPIDAVKSIVKGWPTGTISRTKHFFERAYSSIACLFDDYYCDYYSNRRFARNHTGYIVFNKPKYFPGDTVRFKAFLVKTNGKPVDKDITVSLSTTNKTIELGHLKPYRNGGYEYQFYLHDSLDLQLDRSYFVFLRLNDRKEYIDGSFEYEDYELAKNKLELRLEDKNHYRGKEFKIYAKGTDENNLNLLDARLEILVKPEEVIEYFDQYVFIPDTLYFTRKVLESVDETAIIIPDSVFPSSNLSYNINVRLLTSDNEAITETSEVNYFHRKREFDFSLRSDSLLVIYKENGVPVTREVELSAYDNFANKTDLNTIKTPVKIPLNPYFSEYRANADTIQQIFKISSQPSLISCMSKRTADSIFIVVDNPRKIPFIYNIYKRNTEQKRGYSDSLSVIRKVSDKQNYFVSIRYLWGGKVVEENYRIPFIDKSLNLSVTQPKIVYPGQKVKIEILVTDNNGEPVPEVDLTAYSLTGKFEYSAPEMPYLGRARKNKEIINNFKLNEQDIESHPGLPLNYNSWVEQAGLDSIEYYRFIYPGNKIYRYEYKTEDRQTQFAPFVFSEGEAVPVHVIWCDGRPIYFSWSTIEQPYSFSVDSGFHKIMLRTREKSITLDNFYIGFGKKLIFSLNDNLIQKNVIIESVKPELSDYEKQSLFKYIFPFRDNFGEKFAYIENGNLIQLLNSQKNKQGSYKLAGPVAGNVRFNLMEGYTTIFNHEPFFEYDFAAGLLKMRSVEEETRFPQTLRYPAFEQELSDIFLTRERLEKKWEDYKNLKRLSSARYKNPTSTASGKGMMHIDYFPKKETYNNVPLNILVFRYDNSSFLRVYPGNTSLIHQLDKGLYKLLFFYPDSKYFIADSLLIRPGGLNYFKIQKPVSLQTDTFSIQVSMLIEETIFKQAPLFGEEEKELRQIFNTYQEQFRFSGEGKTVEGHVYDSADDEPIPGVTVFVMGTAFGTVTDINGYYKISLPKGNETLQFSFIGYAPEEVNTGSGAIIDVRLTADVTALDEVVVIGYGVQRKHSLTGAVSSITTNDLLGGIPGVNSNLAQSLQGRVAGVQIVSNSPEAGGAVSIQIRGMGTTEFAKKPLYIINGNVFTGDISELDPALIENIQMLKDVSATSIYGSLGSNGVVIISTKGGSFQPTGGMNIKGAEYDNAFFEAASKSSSIRENFSDYAFWKPKLLTDKNGKASFDVTFPDDVTSWETFYLAMSDNKESGQTQGIIKSYKPLMAQLSVPRFLVKSDTAFAIGKIVNYTPDSLSVKTNFEVDGINVQSEKQMCINSILDTLVVKAGSDSINVKYFLEKDDGYYDGEQKRIPVYPIGLEQTKGNFMILGRDTTFSLSFDKSLGPVSIYARAGMLDVINDEINHLIAYRYLCNEQLASKLKALLAKREIAKYKSTEFEGDKDIERIINLLQKSQKERNLWGWWKNSNTNYWISIHVLEALTQAKQAGFTIKLNESQVTDNLIWELGISTDFSNRTRILKILILLGNKINLSTYIKDLERSKNISLNNYLKLLELKQIYNQRINTDTLQHFQEKTLFGSVYYSDKKDNMNYSNLLDNDIQNTILAYKILKGDTLTNPLLLEKIRNYFLETRRDGYWRNTYESAQIIETILPDLLVNKTQLQKPNLSISGAVNKNITEFPFEMEADPRQEITISKSGDLPVYFTAYQKYWNENPVSRRNDFIITSKFNNDSLLYLKAGQETKLIVDLEVMKDADFIMVNIPIPGGCSYADKGNNYRYEVHREYFKHETAIFCEKLSAGKYTFEIKLIPRYSGKYTLNPAKVELMYFPTFNANNEIKRVIIK